jgi:hypothetical protein
MLTLIVIAGLVVVVMAAIVISDLRPRKVRGTEIIDTRRLERATREARRNAEAYHRMHGKGPADVP